MRIELLPLLQVQRELLNEPRGPRRFQSYLKTMIGPDGEPVLPLAAFNPMSKPHVAELLNSLIAMDAERIAAEAIQESAERLAGIEAMAGMPAYKFGLVIADDAQGGWTNRYLFEAKDRFENTYGVKKGWITALLWSSEVPSPEVLRTETAASIFRTAWSWVSGLPETLGEMLRQEGMTARFAQATPDVQRDLEEDAAIVRHHLGSKEYPAIMACLYGDDVAETLGYPRVGVRAEAAMRLAVSDAFLGRVGAVEALVGAGLAVSCKQHRDRG